MMPEITGRYCNWLAAALALCLPLMLALPAIGAVSRAELRELDRVENALRESLQQSTPLPAALSRGDDRVTLRLAASALFEPDSSTLIAQGLQQPPLQMLLRVLKHRRMLAAQITVFTDDIGGATANQSFSAARAKALGAAFSAAGIPAPRLSQHGAGASEPLSGNDTPEGRLENRRVEIAIVPLRLAAVRPAPATGP